MPVTILVAVVYVIVGVAFPNPPASSGTQFAWRLAAWIVCAAAFAAHIGFEEIRLRRSPFQAALHAAIAVALGGFSLAAAANIHALREGSAYRTSLGLALVIWPIMTGVPAFVVAFVAAAGLARVRRS
jgi:disulfide bond formation protein DsbB